MDGGNGKLQSKETGEELECWGVLFGNEDTVVVLVSSFGIRSLYCF